MSSTGLTCENCGETGFKLLKTHQDRWCRVTGRSRKEEKKVSRLNTAIEQAKESAENMASMAVAYDCIKGCGFKVADGNKLLKHQKNCKFVPQQEVPVPEFTTVSNIFQFNMPLKKQEVPEPEFTVVSNVLQFNMPMKKEQCNFSCQTEIVEECVCGEYISEPTTLEQSYVIEPIQGILYQEVEHIKRTNNAYVPTIFEVQYEESFKPTDKPVKKGTICGNVDIPEQKAIEQEFFIDPIVGYELEENETLDNSQVSDIDESDDDLPQEITDVIDAGFYNGDLDKVRRQLALQYHPDKNPNGEEIMKKINDYIDTLKANADDIEEMILDDIMYDELGVPQEDFQDDSDSEEDCDETNDKSVVHNIVQEEEQKQDHVQEEQKQEPVQEVDDYSTVMEELRKVDWMKHENIQYALADESISRDEALKLAKDHISIMKQFGVTSGDKKDLNPSNINNIVKQEIKTYEQNSNDVEDSGDLGMFANILQLEKQKKKERKQKQETSNTENQQIVQQVDDVQIPEETYQSFKQKYGAYQIEVIFDRQLDMFVLQKLANRLTTNGVIFGCSPETYGYSLMWIKEINREQYKTFKNEVYHDLTEKMKNSKNRKYTISEQQVGLLCAVYQQMARNI